MASGRSAPPSAADLKRLAAQFGITEEDLKPYVKEFESIDKNKDGKISLEELRTNLANFGFKVTKEEATAMLKSADKNKDNVVSLEEFVAVIVKCIKSQKPDLEKEALQAFKMFDINNDGFISMQELRDTMTKLGQPLTTKEAEDMLKMYDKNKDGRIDYKEFLIAWKDIVSKKPSGTPDK